MIDKVKVISRDPTPAEWKLNSETIYGDRYAWLFILNRAAEHVKGNKSINTVLGKIVKYKLKYVTLASDGAVVAKKIFMWSKRFEKHMEAMRTSV